MTSPLRAALRSRLTVAMRERDRDATAVLRSAIAAIENAEAVPAPLHAPDARLGVGVTEADRRVLGAATERAVVLTEVAALTEAQQAYAAAGHPSRAESASAGVAILHGVLAESEPEST